VPAFLRGRLTQGTPSLTVLLAGHHAMHKLPRSSGLQVIVFLASTMPGADPVVSLDKQEKRTRNSARDTVGKVSWDDIELGSSEDEALPASKRARPAAVPQGRSDGVRLVLPSLLPTLPYASSLHLRHLYAQLMTCRRPCPPPSRTRSSWTWRRPGRWASMPCPSQQRRKTCCRRAPTRPSTARYHSCQCIVVLQPHAAQCCQGDLAPRTLANE
jgi:hypothetical protein